MSILISQKALSQCLQSSVSVASMQATLNAAGLEVDSIKTTPAIDPLVVAGFVESVRQHPNADRLRCCKVRVAEGKVLDIVCGCASVRANAYVVVAQVGAVLPGDFKIKAAKLRGEPSHGMLCSASELGLVDEAKGILIQNTPLDIGTSIAAQLDHPDVIFDIDLTPDRGDCLSVFGVARALSAHQCGTLVPLNAEIPAEILANQTEVPSLVPSLTDETILSYHLLHVTMAEKNIETPLWMQAQLWLSGQRPLSFLVDLTNYLMHVIGRPMHAFDADCLQGQPHVRYAKQGETLLLLDQQTVTLSDDMLVIADDSGPIALAGVMGGATTAVSSSTKRVIFEMAHFQPTAISRVVQTLKLSSESSMRFERGVDPDALPVVLCALFAHLKKQTALTDIQWQSCILSDAQRQPIPLRIPRIARILGVTMPQSEAKTLLEHADCQVRVVDDHTIAVTPPSYRHDFQCEIDLIEALICLKGYDTLPTTSLAVSTEQPSMSSIALQKQWSQCLVAAGFHEIIAYSFMAEDGVHANDGVKASVLKIKNPISPKLSVMRPSLIYGLCEAASYNMKRQERSGRLFEYGKRFVANAEGGYDDECAVMAGMVFGTPEQNHWSQTADNKAFDTDFYWLKGVVNQMLTKTCIGQHLVFHQDDSNHLFHPNMSAMIRLNDVPVGVIGRLHPRIIKAFKLPHNTYVFELDMPLQTAQRVPKYQAISKYPSSRKDISFFVCNTVSYHDIIKAVDACKISCMSHVSLFDVYAPNDAKNQKSYSMALTFQSSDHTLTDEMIKSAFERIVRALQDNLNIRLRGTL